MTALLECNQQPSTLLKVVPSREARDLAAKRLNSDLDAIVCLTIMGASAT